MTLVLPAPFDPYSICWMESTICGGSAALTQADCDTLNDVVTKPDPNGSVFCNPSETGREVQSAGSKWRKTGGSTSGKVEDPLRRFILAPRNGANCSEHIGRYPWANRLIHFTLPTLLKPLYEEVRKLKGLPKHRELKLHGNTEPVERVSLTFRTRNEGLSTPEPVQLLTAWYGAPGHFPVWFEWEDSKPDPWGFDERQTLFHYLWCFRRLGVEDEPVKTQLAEVCERLREARLFAEASRARHHSAIH